jgi:deoxyuridine 5'-triphosphate nucleotidohydrolase
VAKVIFENDIQTQQLCTSIVSPIDTVPINIVDSTAAIINVNTSQDKNFNQQMEQGELFGEIMTGEDMEQQDIVNDPTLNMLKTTQAFVPKAWQPNLNTVIEENDYDLAHVNGAIHLKHSSGRKRTQKQHSQYRQFLQDHEACISKAITRNGIYRIQISQAQNDGGANRSVTNNRDLLIKYENIPKYPINGVKDGEVAIYCTGRGYLPWRAESGELILIRCYYCEHTSGTIISPTDVNAQYTDRYSGWVMTTNLDKQTGTFQLTARDGVNHLRFPAYCENNLWYHYLDQITNDEYDRIGHNIRAVVKTLSNGASYELWHNRLGHPGPKVMEVLHKHVDGVPKLKKNKFYSCAACMSSKFRKTHIGTTKRSPVPDDKPQPKIEKGQHLSMDFGFVRGSDWSKLESDGKLVTSMDGYRSYCLIIDRATRYIWIVLTKTKSPPVTQVKDLLKRLKGQVTNAYKTVTTDLGGELGKSKKFQTMLAEESYVLKTTGAHSSAQNGLAEKPNQDLATMMRSMLYGAGLGSKYWSYALRHAVFLKNRLPHSSLQYKTPYEAMNGIKPNLGKIRVFGARAHFMKGTRAKKLDRMDGTGTFMTYKGTDKISYIIDEVTGKERTATHVTYDEAFASVPASKQPPMATALQQSGYRQELDTGKTTLKIKLLDPTAKPPERGSDNAAGLDMYSHVSTIILPGNQGKISTQVAMEIPLGHHGQLFVRSSYALQYQARVEAGTIDSDYRGEIFIIISNNGPEPLVINKGDRIAQMIITKDPSYDVEITETLAKTQRDTGAFGSTGKDVILPAAGQPTKQRKLLPQSNPALPHDKQLHSTRNTAAAATLTKPCDHSPICNVDLSSDPFVDTQTITFVSRGRHRTKGFILKDSTDLDNTVIIDTCRPGTAATKILNWRKRLKGSTLLKINDVPITSCQQAEEILNKQENMTDVNITIGLQEKTPMHDDNGIPIMYFDQLANIATHLQQIQNGEAEKLINPDETNKSSESIVNAIIHLLKKPSLPQILPKSKIKTKRLTRKKLKGSDDWDTWKLAEWQQLDQYLEQKMFGKPCRLPPNANVLNLIWCYNIKDDGRKKARMVCNGKPSNKNTVIFGYTYAKSLDHVGSRVFWAAAAAKNFVVRGADASNAFAEADAPKIPLYVRVNDQYREWWTEKMKMPPIPPGHVLPVHKALQGHPEAPRAWALLIDQILREKLNLKPTTHEPCLYHGQYKGNEILFLRQVDDFAVASRTAQISTDIINEIDKYMKIEIKDLGQLTRYNGVDIVQTKHYIKLNNLTYLNKIINEHKWMIENVYSSNQPLPMSDDKDHAKKIESATVPQNEEEKRQLQVKMNFNYRQAIGELIYAMITCRPDISYPLIKLSQYSANPAEIHYLAVVQIFRYLHATVDDGLLFWRPAPHPDLPSGPIPTVQRSNYSTEDTTEIDSPTQMHSAVDSDWAGDTNHRKSVTGIIIRLAGGTILYKTKYQDTIALSTTEAEFTAACDAGKSILYVRSILDEIKLPQEAATTLYIDNNGALMMGNAQQPTRRTRHIELKKFALLDWIQRDLILMKRISTNDNCSDGMTKQTGRQLFYRHFDYIMGKLIPDYVTSIEKHPNQKNTTRKVSFLDDEMQKLCEEEGTIHMALSSTHGISMIDNTSYSVCSMEHGGDVIPSK